MAKNPSQIIQELEQSVIDIDAHLGDANFGNFTVAGNNARTLLGNAIGQLNAHGAELAKKAAAAAKLATAASAPLTSMPTLNVVSPTAAGKS